jgi:hypothetical protein
MGNLFGSDCASEPEEPAMKQPVVLDRDRALLKLKGQNQGC